MKEDNSKLDEETIGAEFTGAKSPIDEARLRLVEVIKQLHTDLGAALTDEAIAAAAILEEFDLAAFARYKRNLRERHANLRLFDEALRRWRAKQKQAGDGKPASQSPGRPLQGRPLDLKGPEPWDQPVNGAALLDELEAGFRRFLVLPDPALAAIALWAAHAHCHERGRRIAAPEVGGANKTLWKDNRAQGTAPSGPSSVGRVQLNRFDGLPRDRGRPPNLVDR